MLTDKSLFLLVISLHSLGKLVGVNICMIEVMDLEVTVSYLLFFASKNWIKLIYIHIHGSSSKSHLLLYEGKVYEITCKT
jgi:hypothetical protein